MVTPQTRDPLALLRQDLTDRIEGAVESRGRDQHADNLARQCVRQNGKSVLLELASVDDSPMGDLAWTKRLLEIGAYDAQTKCEFGDPEQPETKLAFRLHGLDFEIFGDEEGAPPGECFELNHIKEVSGGRDTAPSVDVVLVKKSATMASLVPEAFAMVLGSMERTEQEIECDRAGECPDCKNADMDRARKAQMQAVKGILDPKAVAPSLS
jgi:hypothetical protein